VLPDVIPEKLPDADPIVPTAVLPLHHVPLVVTSVNDIVVPAQGDDTPLIAAGVGFTVTVAMIEQPPPSV
jgi:hypothetical protein